MIKCCLYPEGINQTEEKMSGYVNLLKWCLYQEEINQIEMSGYVMVLKWCLYQEEYNQTEEEIFIYMLIYYSFKWCYIYFYGRKKELRTQEEQIIKKE